MLTVSILVGCATKRPPLPTHYAHLGTIPGLESVRVWGDEVSPHANTAAIRMREQIIASDPEALQRPQNFLAISGGGQKGAFCAGLLNGWSQHGDRPQFRIVTGISTGALIAPFAFMGEAYDAPLKELYTIHSTKDIIRKKPIRGLFGGKALADSTPLFKALVHYHGPMIDGIAAEYHKGRRLFIGTTNLDAKRPVIWDISAIAASDHPDKANLIHRIVLASASIPGIFPPVLFDVSKDDIPYNELHVDGGVSNQLFLSPFSFSLRKGMDKVGFTGEGTVYIIRNNPVRLDWELVKPTTLAISSASIGSLILNQGNTNQYLISLQAQLDKMECRSAQMPLSFDAESKETFDAEYMRQLFDVGFVLASEGYPWETESRLSDKQ